LAQAEVAGVVRRWGETQVAQAVQAVQAVQATQAMQPPAPQAMHLLIRTSSREWTCSIVA